MNVDMEIVSQGRGTWGHLRYEFQEVNASLATERDTKDGTTRTTFHLLFREPGTTAWDGRDFSSPAERREFVDQSFRDQEPRDDVAPPTLPELYLPFRAFGHPLTSAVFVMDYIQLISDEWTLNIYAKPDLFNDSVSFKPGASGYCDALVELIGQSIVFFEEQLGEFLEIRFSGGSRLIVPWEDALPEFLCLLFKDAVFVWP